MSTPADSGAELVALIHAIRKRWFQVVALRTVGRGAGLAAVAALAGVLVDAIVRPEGTRLVLLAGGTLLLVVALVAAVLRRVQPRPDDRHVARFVEEHASLDSGPPVDDAIVSAVDVLETPASAHSSFSTLIVEGAVRRLRSIDPAHVIDAATLRHSRLEAAGGTGLLALAVLLSAPALSRAIETARFQYFPGAIDLSVQPGNVRLAAGTPLRITVSVRDANGPLTRLTPALTVTTDSENRTVEMHRTDETFEFTFESVDRSFNYRIAAGAARSTPYAVTALVAPRVRRIDLEYTYPAFTGLSPRLEEDGGDIYAPAGTRVRLRVRTDKPVANGEIATAGASVALRPSGDCLLEGDLLLTKDDSYRLRLVDDDGLRASGDTEYFIRLMDDRPPDVRILRPSADQQITPLEEVAIQARADDDYGVAAFDLVYAVAGGPERVVPFDQITGTAIEKVGSRLLPVEDLKVKPGDVITYYARARDVARGKRSTETRSDIFFLEVKPFNEEFIAAQSQASSGAGGTEIEGLIAAQKEIISATWNIERRAGAGRSTDDIAAVAKAQAELKARAERMSRGSGRGRARAPMPERAIAQPQGRPDAPAGQGDPVANAVAAMGRAAAQLDAQKTKDAISHEMSALNGLLQAQAEIRRRQVSQGASGSGSGGNRAGQDLTALFDKELQRQQRTNYETRSTAEEKPPRAEGDDATLDRIRDLARRQEDLSRRQRELADTGVGAEEMKRQLEKLTREQAELRQQAEDLARDLSRRQQGAGQQEKSQAGQQGGQQAQGPTGTMHGAAEQMRSATSDLRREDAKGAAENSARAAAQLRRAEEQMRGKTGEAQGRRAGQLQLEAQQIAQEQRRIAAEAERLEGSQGAAAGDARRQLADDKERLAGRVDEWKRAAKEQGPTAGAPDAAALAATAKALDQERIAERMRESATGMRGVGGDGKPAGKGAAASEQEIARALERAMSPLGGSQTADTRQLSEQLEQTRQIRERLNRLEQQMRQTEAAAASAGRGTVQGRRQGSTGRDGQQGSRGTSGDGREAGDLKKLQQEYQQELQRAQQALGRLSEGQQRSGRDMSTPEGEEFSRSAPGTEAFKQDRSRWESLRKDIDLSLEEYEASISDRLSRQHAQDRLNAGGSDRVPESYRAWIARYYESLAKVRK